MCSFCKKMCLVSSVEKIPGTTTRATYREEIIFDQLRACVKLPTITLLQWLIFEDQLFLQLLLKNLYQQRQSVNW